MIIFHHPAQAKVNRIKWIQTDTYKINLYVIPTYMNDSLCKKKVTRVRKKLPDSILRSCSYTFQGIPFLQVNAQYPSRRTKLIVIKCFLGRLRPCDSPLSKKYIEIFYILYIQRIYLLLI